ncbi:hypothetical protein HPB52_024699 [Rhipicephalus sanguineus]|uniref:Uncharacterized protein n=1 Tax=Rhipicephalus sanguineus TaxID=34632 RepID=A0A9D4TE06_RHISA|nr:hypothetical protein HPB52_024699 [Rhipicephalus sanguineus]
MAEAWRQLRPLAIANSFAHAGFSRVSESIEEDIGADFSGCDELCNEVRKATGCVSDTEDGEIAFEEYALYEADVPVTGMLSDTDIIEMALSSKQQILWSLQELLLSQNSHKVSLATELGLPQAVTPSGGKPRSTAKKWPNKMPWIVLTEAVCVSRTMYVIDQFACEVKDPLVVAHWACLSSPTHNSVKINILSQGYETMCR